jgi:hypothetical protein
MPRASAGSPAAVVEHARDHPGGTRGGGDPFAILDARGDHEICSMLE